MTHWTGNLGTGTSDYTGYSRSHEITGPSKSFAISGSSDPLFRGDPSRYNPEDLIVASLSACHMLWFLHLCADAGIVVTDYADTAIGTMFEEHGRGKFEQVTLHPRVKITDPAKRDHALALHESAHEACNIANSVNFPVHCKPTFIVSKEPSNIDDAGAPPA